MSFVFKFYPCLLWLHLHTQQDLDEFTMPLPFYRDYIIYYHTAAMPLVGLTQTYFIHPDYLVVQSWICITDLLPDSIN